MKYQLLIQLILMEGRGRSALPGAAVAVSSLSLFQIEMRRVNDRGLNLIMTQSLLNHFHPNNRRWISNHFMISSKSLNEPDHDSILYKKIRRPEELTDV